MSLWLIEKIQEVLWVMRFFVQDTELNISVPNLVLYFYLSHMPQHPIMMDLIDAIEEKHKLKIDAIDAEYFAGLCRRFEIKSVPTLIFLKDGKISGRLIGIPKLSQVVDIVPTGDAK